MILIKSFEIHFKNPPIKKRGQTKRLGDKDEKGIIWRSKKQAYLLTLIDDEYFIEDERESVLNVAASGHYQDK